MPDIGSTTSTAGSLTVGDLLTSTIDFAGDVDWFAVSLVSGTRYHINLGGTTGGLTNPYLQVIDGSGNSLLASNDNSGAGANAYLDFTAGQTGTFFLSAASSGGTGGGEYALSIFEDDIPS